MKLIAEPWDLGEGGYQVGKFPVGWAEWNDKYRDAVRAYWKGDGGLIGDLAYRITGSSDLYARSGRRPYASVNFISAHDGFTLQDLVSYNSKHNELNGEDNRDGTDNNRSWNCGVEGPTDDLEINQLRARQKRNFVATLFLSQGVPMLLAGDEIGHSQGGNNNAYGQDNEISWLDWDPAHVDTELLAFAQRMISIRFFAGATSSRAEESGAPGLKTLFGSGPTAKRCRTRNGIRSSRAASAFHSREALWMRWMSVGNASMMTISSCC